MASSSCVTLSQVLTISLLLSAVSCLSQSQSHAKSTQTRPFILPIGKDPKTNLFYSPIGIGTPRHDFDLVIDLGGSMLWYDCNNHYNSTTYHPVHCKDSKNCNWDDGCTGCNDPFKPGCSNDTCGAFIINPLAGFIFSGDKGRDDVVFSHTIVSNLVTGCTNSDGFTGDSVLLKGLPNFTKGIIGLARTNLSLPLQLSSSHKLARKFSLCLPSSNKKGLGSLFIGGAPHNSSSNFLFTTPLIVNPFSTAPIFTEGDASYEYFLDVKSIKVNGQVLNFKSSLLSIDKKGIGGTKISTMNPFTVLHDSIYKPLVRDFVKKASDKKIKRVESIAPFGACFDFSTIGRTKTELDVPTIDLVLRDGIEWTIYGGNSMVLVNKKVACLGFVDGGKATQTSVVIGGHQLEDKLLVFDLVSSKLSLHNARCNSNFKI